MADLKQLLKNAFAEVICELNPAEEVLAKYFSRDYQQYVDGRHLNFDGFVKHKLAQKKTVSSIQVTFKHMVEEDDKVSTVHLIEIVEKGGGKLRGQVNALFQMKGGKIILCDELTRIARDATEN